MANIIIYDPIDTLVAGRVTEYLPSVNTPDYDLITDKLVNPDLTGVTDIDSKYWKVVDNTVEEMTVEEKDIMANASSVYVDHDQNFSTSSKSYKTLSSFYKCFPEGKRIIDVTFAVKSNTKNRTGVVRVSVGDSQKECGQYIKEKNIPDTKLIRFVKHYTEEKIETITLEVKAVGNATITVSDLIVDINK